MAKEFLLSVSLIACVLASSSTAQEPNRKGIEFFEKRIRPVLVEHCYQCHSADAKELGGKLRLDSRAGVLAGGESGPAIVANEPKASLLIKALRYDGLEMPPKKQLSESVIADFVKWVQMGAPDPRDEKVAAKDASSPEGAMDLEAGKKFWSFQPIANPQPPKIKSGKWARSDLDKFVLAKLEANGLKPAADADARTLARRLAFDLTGLPLTPEQIDQFSSDFKQHGSSAVEKLVDELLDSPQFGERWARHWLDIARYGESNGNVRNATFPHAWRYRDYVINALNQDKPYDRFVTEQIAGDLLPYDSLDQQNEQLIATGFLAIGSKPNAQGNPNFQMDLVADQIEVITTSVMALTVACARCHDHKYDPVPTRDYYALAGIFTSTETLYGATGNTMGAAPPTELHALAIDGKRPEFAKDDDSDDDKDSKNRGKKKQGKKNGKGNTVRKYPAGTALAMGVRDAKSPSDCRINIKGETKTLGASVPRGFIEVCSIDASSPKPSADQSGRLELANWLTNGKHPLTARVAVNRIWHHLFGQGIVRTPDNFGLHGERPTHPELLDYLATKFVADGWSIKKMIRTLVLSRTYQMSSQFDEAANKIDPDNNLLWRHNRRRMDAETFRDSVLATSGKLELEPGKKSVLSQLGEVLIQDKLTPDKIHKPSNHRSIYLCMMRSGEPEELLIFDLADPSLIVGARNVTTVPAQGLFLMNSPFVVEQSRNFAQRLLAETNGKERVMDDTNRIALAYRLALQRPPTSGEAQRSLAFITDTQTAIAAGADTKAAERQRLAAWSTFCQSLFASNEFRYFD